MDNSICGFNKRLEIAKEKIAKMEDRLLGNI
jgi:hypothetical protein